MSFFAELRRRNVFRVGIAYGIMGWVLLQAADFLLDLIAAPELGDPEPVYHRGAGSAGGAVFCLGL